MRCELLQGEERGDGRKKKKKKKSGLEREIRDPGGFLRVGSVGKKKEKKKKKKFLNGSTMSL